MKILMVSSYLPYPLHSGGQVRLYNLIKELSPKHEITLICEKRSHQTKEDIKEVEKICKKVITVERRKQWRLQNVVKSVSSSNSFLVTGHTHSEMQKRINEELEADSFDVIHVETFYVMQNVLVLSMPPIVLVEHNIEYQVYQRFVDRVPLPLRPLLSLDVAKIKKEEEAAWEAASALVAVSEHDKKVMERTGFASTIVANGVDIEKFKMKPFDSPRLAGSAQGKKVLFIGDFKWIQNRDTVKWIIKEIWPQISAKFKAQSAKFDLKLWVVGRSIPESVKSLTDDPDVIFDEASSSKPTPEIFQEASVLLAPIRVGGGTSYKILESMACGTPVVTMQMSADAIHAKDGQEIMVGQTAEELAERTIQLLQEERIYEKIAMNGRKLIEGKYSWKEIAKDLEKVYESC